MARACLLGIVALVGVGACGQTESDPRRLNAVGGATAGAAGDTAAGAPGGASNGGSVAGGVELLAGAGGSGGASPAFTPVEECKRYCETLAYRLPGALCEDWNRDGWGRPEFCVGAYDKACGEYCSEVYETVSPACAEVLPPAIRCVAPTYASLSPPLVDDCWLRECRDLLFTMVSACYGLREQLAAARATWQASGVLEYQLEYDLAPDVKAQVLVRPGSEPEVKPAAATAWTVPRLFDEVERYLDTEASTATVEYDADLGHVAILARLQGCDSTVEGVSGVEVTPLP